MDADQTYEPELIEKQKIDLTKSPEPNRNTIQTGKDDK